MEEMNNKRKKSNRSVELEQFQHFICAKMRRIYSSVALKLIFVQCGSNAAEICVYGTRYGMCALASSHLNQVQI